MPPPPACPILVLEPDADIRRLLHDVLAEEGCSVVGVATEAAAEVQLAQAWPALVLLDVPQPGPAGLAFARALRRAGVTVPLVALSAWSPEPEPLAVALGIGWVAKPFALEELFAALAPVLPCRQHEPTATGSPTTAGGAVATAHLRPGGGGEVQGGCGACERGGEEGAAMEGEQTRRRVAASVLREG